MPGQSLQEEINRILEDGTHPHVVAIIIAWVITALEFCKYIWSTPPSPGVYTMVAIATTFICSYQILKTIKKVRALRLGLDGEKAVGQYLERLREQGFQVFHDVLGDQFNIDHVLIGEKGVFTIETKTFSKPAKGQSRIRFVNGELQANGFTIDRNPLEQARAAANWIDKVLCESTGRNIRVHSVILFPGWWIEPLPSEKAREVWVLEPKALPAFLERTPNRISSEDAKLLSYHLSRYIRQTNNVF